MYCCPFYRNYWENPFWHFVSFAAALLLLILPLKTVFSENARRVEVFAHRGLLEHVPENTFAALNIIAELGIDGVAIDIRQTQDKQLVLMCDETLDRTTDGKGRVDQLTYAEIQQYDAGSWRGAEFAGERVPLLSDVLMFCKVNNLKLILNVKQNFLGKKVLDLVREYEMFERVYFWGKIEDSYPGGDTPQGKELVYVSSSELSEEKIYHIHEEGKNAFSIMLNSDNRRIMQERIKKGVDVILVDYPCVAMDVLNNKCPAITHTKKKNEKKNIRRELDTNAEYILNEVEALIETIKGPENNKARTAALSLILLPEKYTVPFLIRLLEDENSEVKQNVIWALGFCSEEIVVEYIEPLLKDDDPEVRRETVLALRRIGAKQSGPTFIEALREENNKKVKSDIARTLGALGGQMAVFPLIDVLMKDTDWQVKSACIEALGSIGSAKSMRAIADILVADGGEDAAWARTKAAWALSAMGEKSIPLLLKALRDNEEVTRRRAGWALVKIGTPAVRAVINSLNDVNKHTRERAAQILGWIGDEKAVTSLIWALKDKDDLVVSSAAWALGRLGNSKALPALQALVRHKDTIIRESVIEAIERIMRTNNK
ncbi:MAG: HEAT repeat domain-containing protein [Candidatus Brocadiaceae bacterium]|nr:HEAT repeat domain-containing protein [Candidatus Brocadiaceae bacterium]